MSKTLWIACGIPGSGKSTWIREHINKTNSIHCSRDEVRFAMLKDNEDYFAHEDEVWCAWIKQIKDGLENPEVENIYVDATHLNNKAREKVLKELITYDFDIKYLVFAVPVDTCLERNEGRTERAYVPRSVIRRMFFCFEFPKGDNVYFINEKGEFIDEPNLRSLGSSLWA